MLRSRTSTLSSQLHTRENRGVDAFAVSETVRSIGQQTRNWSRWGDGDECGTANLITPERLAAAARLVRRGIVFDLSIPLDASGPQPGGQRINPVLLMSQTGQGQHLPGGFHFADDYVFMPLQAGTRWDALAHVYYDDVMWNGYPASDITSRGARRNSIDRQADELDAALAAQGHVQVGPGDVLLVRTGWYQRFRQHQDRIAFMSAEPGLGMSCAGWLRERDVAAVASDNWGVEAFAGEDGMRTLELHMVLIRDMGLTLGELFDLEELAADCRDDGVWEFFFCGPPLKMTGAVGSPVNPLALK
jgi:kynurenine formamidase